MRFHRLDLNLLVVLDALLSTSSVSLAAEKICLSQSAVSGSLARLREFFDDDLLIPKGRQMVLSPRAETLIGPVTEVLELIRSTILAPQAFEPETSERTVRIMASDYTVQALLSEGLKRIGRLAPGIKFELESPGDNILEPLERGSIDLLFSVESHLSAEHPSQFLFEDDYVVICCKENTQLGNTISETEFFRLGHVTVEFGRNRFPAYEEVFLRQQELRRPIEMVVPSFLIVPGMIVGTERIALLHRKLARQVVKQNQLRMLESPIKIPPIRQAVQWHRSSDHDPAIQWVVRQLLCACQPENLEDTESTP